MPNELILLLSLFIFYIAVVFFFRFFKLQGLYCFSVLATITANIEVMILINAFGLEQTLGNVLFATTFLITDIVSELYGKKEAKKVVNLNIMTAIMFVAISQIWMLFTPSSNDKAMSAISSLFSSTPRLIFASIAVYAVSQKLDVWLYHKWWKFTEKWTGDKNKFLFLRNNGSTLLSQLVNTVLYSVLAFAGAVSTLTLLQIIASSYVIFIITSLADTPILYWVRKIHYKQQNKLLTAV